ncbi:DUF222 domain-containing protein [Microbacterium sp.]|uniref:DUF222 domain-containing protein n=1 Tax=Microbacterium sp. TaxID=51671 RepID=UPI002811FBBE|nr:DUF222 domain-containing protein [Microbacterium sp.]
MEALLGASDEDVALLDEIVSSVAVIEQTLAGVQAARDGMLALASQVSLRMAENAGGVDASDLTARAVAAELAGVLRVSDRTVQRRMADADWLVSWFPEVWAAQGAGRISAGHTRVILEAGEHLQDARDRAAYAERVLEVAEGESPNRLRPIARGLAEQFQPVPAEERHRNATAKHGVWVRDLSDGNSQFIAVTSSARAHAMLDRLSGMAAARKDLNAREVADARVAGATIIHHTDAVTPAVHQQPATTWAEWEPSAFGPAADRARADAADAAAAAEVCADASAVFVADDRSMGQLRADLLAELVLTGIPAGHDTPDGLLARITAHVEVTVPVFTLMGLDAHDLERALAASGVGVDLPGCSPTRSPAPCSPWTATGPPHACAVYCTPATNAAVSSPAGTRRGTATSITPSRHLPAAPPPPTTSVSSVGATMC